MKADSLIRRSVVDLSRALEQGELTSERLVSAIVDRIEAREDDVRAWAYFNPDQAVEEARRLDRTPRLGPLHGIPVAIKDIIDTADMPTAYGSPIYKDYRPGIDASPVAAVRAGGGLVLGKTVTAEFAHRLPGPTRNPHDLERTPGGSSSGSAAAVADGMVPISLTTQTTASTIRPASFCGLVGYRPSFGMIGCMGVRQSSPSFDSVGILARTVEDCALLRDVLLEVPTRLPSGDPGRVPRIGFCRTPFWHKVDPEAQAVLEKAVGNIAASGAQIVEVETPPAFAEVQNAHRCVSSYELVRSLTAERREHFEMLSPCLREGRLADGFQIGAERYIAAIETLEKARIAAHGFFEPFDFIVCPSASGIAPKGLGSSGVSDFCVLWTALHTPAITVPLSVRIEDMPLGLQLVSRRGSDLRLFDFAKWVERRV